jgi:hypothetical protein
MPASQRIDVKYAASIRRVVVVVVVSRSPGHATHLTDPTTVTPRTHESRASRGGANITQGKNKRVELSPARLPALKLSRPSASAPNSTHRSLPLLHNPKTRPPSQPPRHIKQTPSKCLPRTAHHGPRSQKVPKSRPKSYTTSAAPSSPTPSRSSASNKRQRPPPLNPALDPRAPGPSPAAATAAANPETLPQEASATCPAATAATCTRSSAS